MANNSPLRIVKFLFLAESNFMGILTNKQNSKSADAAIGLLHHVATVESTVMYLPNTADVLTKSNPKLS